MWEEEMSLFPHDYAKPCHCKKEENCISMEQKDIQQLQDELRTVCAPLQLIRSQASQIIAGQEKLIDRILLAMIADGHVLLEGVPGLAKTLTVKTIAQTLDCSFSRIQFTPDLLPADVVGTRIYNAATGSFSVKAGPVCANMILADEINRAPAKVQSALLESMQEKQVTIGGEKIPLPEPFLVMATQNPIEQEGTYPLPEAQLDRFMFKLKVGYPERSEERTILERMAHPRMPEPAVTVASLADILTARRVLDRIYIDEKILEYILDIVIATRPGYRDSLSSRQNSARLDFIDAMLTFGASPRAGVALSLAARGLALLNGRAYVLPQDVKEIAPDVLRHRLILSYEAEAENVDSDAVIERLLAELRTP